MIYQNESDCPNKLYIPRQKDSTSEMLMKIPIDGSMQNECKAFDVGTVFKKKKSNGLTLHSGTSNIGADLVFDTDDEFSAWDNAVVEAQEMNEGKRNRLKQARDILKEEYSHESENSLETSNKFDQCIPLLETGKWCNR